MLHSLIFTAGVCILMAYAGYLRVTLWAVAGTLGLCILLVWIAILTRPDPDAIDYTPGSAYCSTHVGCPHWLENPR